MEHPDIAQIAALGGALGSVLALLARGRLSLLAGLALLLLAELGLAFSLGGGPADKLTSPSGAAAALIGLGVLAAAAALLVRRPALVPLLVLAAAPLRPPIEYDPSSALLVSVATNGALGRLLPLYFVLLAAVSALAWTLVRGSPAPGAPPGGRTARRRLLRGRGRVDPLGRRPRGGRQPARVLQPPLRVAARG